MWGFLSSKSWVFNMDSWFDFKYYLFFFLMKSEKSILVIQSNPSVIWGNCPEWHEDYWNELDESWIILDTYVSSPESQISNRVSHLNIRHLNVKKQTKKLM